MNGTIYGRIVDAHDGRPIDSATVIVVNGPAPVRDIAALTGPDGEFVIDVPVDGMWSVRVFEPSGCEREFSIYVPQDEYPTDMPLPVELSVPEED